MHQNRRRKKRPSYGVRTIEIVRGRNGFGFTISGQAPCILSCIAGGSPAEAAGLRPGDYLIAVNGQNVSKALHDDVVHMIGSCLGLLKLQIAENYYSNSSDDEVTPTARPRPKYPHRFRQRQNQSSHHHHHQQEGASACHEICPNVCGLPKYSSTTRSNDGHHHHHHDYKNIGDVQSRDGRRDGEDQQPSAPSKYSGGSATLPAQRQHQQQPAKTATKRAGNVSRRAGHNGIDKENSRPSLFSEQEINNLVYPSLQQLQCNAAAGVAEEQWIFRAVVGYLGTIEMPKEPQPSGHRLAAIRSCIRRLRVEKKVHTLVLLRVFSEHVTLTNAHGAALADFPTDRITFCGAYTDDKRIFGLVTSRPGAGAPAEGAGGGSCHVFMVDPQLLNHEEHARTARNFRLDCSPDMGSGRGECAEFPENVDPVLVALVGLYRGRGGLLVEMGAHVSPQPPSNTSSNSDSGIGFRDDGGLLSDRVSVVDLDHDDLPGPVAALPAPLRANQLDGGPGKLTIRAMPDPVGLSRQECWHSADDLCRPTPPSCGGGRGHLKYLGKSLEERPPAPACLRDLSSARATNMTPVTVSARPPVEEQDQASRLSPKVYPGGSSCGSCATRTNASDLDHDLEEGSEGTAVVADDVTTEGTGECEGSQDAHAGTPEEDDENSVENNDGGQRWSRANSFRRHFKLPSGQNRAPEDVARLDGATMGGGRESAGSSMAGSEDGAPHEQDRRSQRGSTSDPHVGRCGSWAGSFENLLADPAGLHTFAEFLKKEFSFENIAFWVACERFRRLDSESNVRVYAKEIFDRYLAMGSPEPVNVDSHARQLAQQNLDKPTLDVFALAQHQIFNLMKFDCYARFLKSQLFQQCVLREVSNEQLPFLGDDSLDPEISDPAMKSKTGGKEKRDDSEDRRRKSLLPWHRTKSVKTKSDKSNSKKWLRRGEEEPPPPPNRSGSHLCLTNLDAATQAMQFTAGEGSAVEIQENMCRILLPDGSTTMVTVRKGESVAVCLDRVMDRRGLRCKTFDVIGTSSSKTIDQASDSSELGGQLVRLDEMTLLHVELLNKKTVTVKAKPSSPLLDALRPLFLQNNYVTDDVVCHMHGSTENLDWNKSASTFDSRHIVIAPKKKLLGIQLRWASPQHFAKELNGLRVPEFLQPASRKDDQNSDEKNRAEIRRTSLCDTNSSAYSRPAKPPVAARPFSRKEENEEMYDLWKRAQRSRLDDQRGTEINFELPDFLKMHEGRASEPAPSRPEHHKGPQREPHSKLQRLHSEVFPPGCSRLNLSDDNLLWSGAPGGGVIPSRQQADEYFGACRMGPGDPRVPGEHRGHLDLGSFEAFKKSRQASSSSSCSSRTGTRPTSHPPLAVAPPTWFRSASVPVATPTSPAAPPPPAENADTSIHGEAADFPPPSPMAEAPPQIPQRRLAMAPPLPPKPLPRPQTRRPPINLLGNSLFSDEEKTSMNLLNNNNNNNRVLEAVRRLSATAGGGNHSGPGEPFNTSFV